MNHWFRKSNNDSIPKSVNFIILNYIIQQRITSLVYVDYNQNSIRFDDKTSFTLDGIYCNKTKDKLFNNELRHY